MNALDMGYASEQAIARVPDGSHQQPGYGFHVRRIRVRGRLADDLAAVLVFPGGAGGVMADHRALVIMEIRIRGLERPQRLAIGARAAGVDLPPGGMRPEDELFTRGSLQARWDIR